MLVFQHECGGKVVPAEQFHTALMLALEFGYAKVIKADAHTPI